LEEKCKDDITFEYLNICFLIYEMAPIYKGGVGWRGGYPATKLVPQIACH